MTKDKFLRELEKKLSILSEEERKAALCLSGGINIWYF